MKSILKILPPLIAAASLTTLSRGAETNDEGAITDEKPDVTERLEEKVEDATEEAKEDFTPPTRPENPGTSAKPDPDRQADAPRVEGELIDRCSDFVRETLDENQRIRSKEDGLSDPDFKVTMGGLVNPYAVMSTMAMPGETLDLKISGDEGLFECKVSGGSVMVGSSNTEWKWEVPSNPGIYCATFTDKSDGTAMLIHALVLEPYDGSGKIGDYKIGEYKREPLNGNPRYEFPKGFVKVTKENEDTWLTPHLQLKQFVCKQSQSRPTYVLVETRLLLKLETIIAELYKGGVAPNSLYLTSAFRTPHYNEALGNETSYSRHLYGDAADIFVDRNDDARLDDLNKDGKVNDQDAKYLSSLVDKVSKSLPDYFEGGLGFYGFRSDRTAFIHTDTRGYTARWGF